MPEERFLHQGSTGRKGAILIIYKEYALATKGDSGAWMRDHSITSGCDCRSGAVFSFLPLKRKKKSTPISKA